MSVTFIYRRFLAYFGLFWPILAYFGRFWPPEALQGGLWVIWGCPGVIPGGSQRIIAKFHKIWKKSTKSWDFPLFCGKIPILAYLAYFDLLSPPEAPQGGLWVVWGCPGVFPGGSQRIVAKFHKLWKNPQKVDIFHFFLEKSHFGLFWPILTS